MFASNEEALAAGVAAYQRMLDVEMRALSGDKGALDQYPEVAEGEYLKTLREVAQRFEEQGHKPYGNPQTRDAKLQSVRNKPRTTVVFYICLDMNGVKYMDLAGNPVRETSNPRNFTMMVTAAAESTPLKIQNVEKWSDTPC